MQIANIHPYENNPRKNDEAVDDVVASIRQCGNIDPIEVDEDGVILSGHTRLKALQRLGETETDCIVISGLSDEQKRKYRLLANKTGEKAGWDWELLEQELDGLDFGDFDFGFNMNGGTPDNLDDLFSEAPPKEEKEPEQIQCPHCKLWFTPDK